MYKIAKEKLSELFALIAEKRELYLPVNVNGHIKDSEISQGRIFSTK